MPKDNFERRNKRKRNLDTLNTTLNPIYFKVNGAFGDKNESIKGLRSSKIMNKKENNTSIIKEINMILENIKSFSFLAAIYWFILLLSSNKRNHSFALKMSIIVLIIKINFRLFSFFHNVYAFVAYNKKDLYSNNIISLRIRSNKTKIKLKNNYYKIKARPYYKKEKGMNINIAKHSIIFSIIKIFLFINLFIQIKPVNKMYFNKNHFSNVTLRINVKGNNNVFSSQSWYTSDNYPKEVIINGNIQTNIKPQYDLENYENSIKLIWDKTISYGACIFCKCPNIAEFDFSNFDTSDMTYMGWMFWGNNKITSLDLSNFDTSKVSDMESMFSGCSNLQYINMKYFDDSKLTFYDNIFAGVPDNVVVCLNEKNTKIIKELKKKSCLNMDCSTDWESKQKKIISPKINGCGCELNSCLSCSSSDENIILCKECKTSYYKKENDNSNIEGYFYCYKDPKGYYLDNNDLLYKKCYDTCETCKIKGDIINHNCLECNETYSFEISINNYKNCYKQCEYNYYFDDLNNYICTINSSCPTNYPKLKERQCIKNDINILTTDINKIFSTAEIMTILNETIYIKKTQIFKKNNNINDLIDNIKQFENETKELPKEKEIEYYDEIITNIESIFSSDNYDTSNLDKGEDEIIQTKKMTITLTTTSNQKNNNKTNNITKIDLGHCEFLPRNHYNLSENETLYMKKIDINQEGMRIPKIEYSVYCKLNGTNLIKLNLSICENSKISLSIPIEISESLDKFNTSSDYYNDICYSTTSESGTDISLKDRQKEFVEGNKTVCQDECDFSDYNENIKTANCSCTVKESSDSFADMNINKSKLYDNFEINNKKDFSNLGITSCNILASKENIESNTGFFLLLIILVIFVVIFIIFCSRGYNSLENKIDGVIQKQFKNETNNQNNKIKRTILKQSHNQHNNQMRANNNNLLHFNNQKHYSNKKLNNSKKKFINNNVNKKDNNNIIKNSSKIQNTINKNNKKTTSSQFKPDTDYEYNWLTYKEALIYDKRSSCEYYGCLLKNKQLFLFTFCSFNDYNSGIVKKFMLFLSFAMHYTANALFFTEVTFHQIYEDEGKYNFGYQISNILFSSIISIIILRLMLHFLVLTDKDILQVKKQANKQRAINMKRKKLKCMKIKFAIFFILNFILLTLFWYYLTCFNAVYKNTKIYLIENTCISFAFSLFYPFIINIFPTMLRICSLHSSENNQSYIYKMSQIIQLI